ncbi:MAG TPA: hypothetical protein VN923_02710, partial [Thermoanaerobaculia bacterium]|nr:hypothetical protein [Thermoanaerobaculia bacterium]
LDGVSALALLVLASFVIERVVSGVLFVLPTLRLLPDLAQLEEPAARARTERRHTYFRFFLSAALAAVILWQWPSLRILALFSQLSAAVPPWLDPVVTWVVLMGGADRIAALVKLPGGGSAPAKREEPPIEVRGRLTLDDSRTQG